MIIDFIDDQIIKDYIVDIDLQESCARDLMDQNKPKIDCVEQNIYDSFSDNIRSSTSLLNKYVNILSNIPELYSYFSEYTDNNDKCTLACLIMQQARYLYYLKNKSLSKNLELLGDPNALIINVCELFKQLKKKFNVVGFFTKQGHLFYGNKDYKILYYNYLFKPASILLNDIEAYIEKYNYILNCSKKSNNDIEKLYLGIYIPYIVPDGTQLSLSYVDNNNAVATYCDFFIK